MVSSIKFQITSFFIILLFHYIVAYLPHERAVESRKPQVKDRLGCKVDSHPNFIYVITRQMDLIRKLSGYIIHFWKKINYFRNNKN
jgi:hypothetical protein